MVKKKLSVISEIGGEKEHLYAIEYSENHQSETGYVWGGLLAESSGLFSYSKKGERKSP